MFAVQNRQPEGVYEMSCVEIKNNRVFDLLNDSKRSCLLRVNIFKISKLTDNFHIDSTGHGKMTILILKKAIQNGNDIVVQNVFTRKCV